MTIAISPRTLAADAALRARAAAVIPRGMYGHLSVQKVLPEGFPQFYARGEGAMVWDVDGNDYVDFMCAFGPMVVGYANAKVDAAAGVHQRLGDAIAGPTPVLVEAAENLVDTVAHSDWAMFAKNGADATSMAVVIARAATGRKKLLKATSAYHGATPWFTPMPAGVTAEDRANIVEFNYNDLESVKAAVDSADGDVAAIILTPHQHDAMVDQEEVRPEFARGVRELATKLGIVLILDEVRTGFRIDMAGSWEPIGVRPDLTAFSKAIANGYAFSAVTGIDALADAASEVYVTGSFWMGSVAMAASIETTRILREGGLAELTRAGADFRTGLARQAADHGFDLVQTGPVSMPMLRFGDDVELTTAFAFTAAAVRHGVILHPWHNMFLSSAHTPVVIAAALERTDAAFTDLARTRP